MSLQRDATHLSTMTTLRCTICGVKLDVDKHDSTVLTKFCPRCEAVHKVRIPPENGELSPYCRSEKTYDTGVAEIVVRNCTVELLTLNEVLQRIQSSSEVFYVYALCYPDGTPFYVGKGTRDRLRAHESEVDQSNSQTLKHEIIRRLRREYGKISYLLVGLFDDEDEAFSEERRLIRQYGRRDNGTGILTNRTDGGEGRSATYGLDKWAVDDQGIVTAKLVERPIETDLTAPRFMASLTESLDWKSNYANWTTDKETERRFQEERKRPTGPEMREIVLWHGGGLTVQFFYPRQSELETDVANALFTAKKYGTHVELLGRFRFFIGRRKVLEDRTGVPAYLMSNGYQLIVWFLNRLSEEPRSINGHFRFDPTRGVSDYPSTLRKWLRDNKFFLQRLAIELADSLPPRLPPIREGIADVEPPPVHDPERFEIHRLASDVLRRHSLRASLADDFDLPALRAWILYDWAVESQPEVCNTEEKSCHFRAISWRDSTKRPGEIQKQWNDRFPTYALPPALGLVPILVNQGHEQLQGMRADSKW